MNGLSLLKSFRNKLFITLLCIVGIIFGFGFYTFIKVNNIEAIIGTGVLTETDIVSLQNYINQLAGGSFLFIGITVLLVFGLLINLILTLTFSLRKILLGIQEIEKGNLSYRVNLKSEDEFGMIARFLNIATDNIERSQKEILEAKSNIEQKVEERTRQLNEERAKLLASIQSLTRGYMLIDRQNNILLINPAMQRIFDKEKPVEQYTMDYITLRFKEAFPIDHHIAECLENKKTIELKDVSFASKHLRILLAPVIVSSQGNPIGVVILIEDITEILQLERMKLDFVSMAAHELRTPLTSIIGHISILVEEGSKNFNEEQKTFLNRTLVSAQELLVLTNNILNASKIERGALLLNKQPIDWKKLLGQLIFDHKTQASDKHIDIRLDLPKEPLPYVHGDVLQITEVFNNLLGNAITYTKENGEVTISARVDKDTVVTAVTDTGIGIPKEAQEHLFAKFYRVTSALDESSNSKGTGLGLFISKSIIDLHKGKIWVESKQGKGSTFYVQLPVSKSVKGN